VRVLHQSGSVRAKRGRGREGEPSEWTGWAARPECVREANPTRIRMTAGTSLRKEAEVIGPQAAEKSR
jgi:hypothetical protein